MICVENSIFWFFVVVELVICDILKVVMKMFMVYVYFVWFKLLLIDINVDVLDFKV